MQSVGNVRRLAANVFVNVIVVVFAFVFVFLFVLVRLQDAYIGVMYSVGNVRRVVRLAE